MSLNATVFKFYKGTHLEYLKIAYSFLIEAYQEQMQNNYNASNNDENTIRYDLVKIAKTKKDNDFIFNWDTEYDNFENKSRIDIALVTPLSLGCDLNNIFIECKIVGEKKYIGLKCL